ncbi:S-layer homology domain-containing protein [Microbacterium sp. CH-015]|uniref:S-layer homology domain-containing protein n=1 Tax=Microbacterium sp. CH-015 TaxID=3406734 RepID=UPI003C7128CA
MPFSDVDASSPSAAAIRWLFYAGIARGWDDPLDAPTFRPDLDLTREALVIMLSRFRDGMAASRS